MRKRKATSLLVIINKQHSQIKRTKLKIMMKNRKLDKMNQATNNLN